MSPLKIQMSEKQFGERRIVYYPEEKYFLAAVYWYLKDVFLCAQFMWDFPVALFGHPVRVAE